MALSNPAVGAPTYTFNFQNFDLSAGITITKVSHDATDITLSPTVICHNQNDIIEFLTRMALMEGIVESGQNIIKGNSTLNFGNSITNAITFTYNAVSYVLKSDGSRARTAASYASTPYPGYTINVAVKKDVNSLSGTIVLIISKNVVFRGDAIAYAKQYNKPYTVNSTIGDVTITLNDGSTTIVNPFKTLANTIALFADTLQLCSYGIAKVNSGWATSAGAVTMTAVLDQNLTASLQGNANDLA